MVTAQCAGRGWRGGARVARRAPRKLLGRGCLQPCAAAWRGPAINREGQRFTPASSRSTRPYISLRSPGSIRLPAGSFAPRATGSASPAARSSSTRPPPAISASHRAGGRSASRSASLQVGPTSAARRPTSPRSSGWISTVCVGLFFFFFSVLEPAGELIYSAAPAPDERGVLAVETSPHRAFPRRARAPRHPGFVAGHGRSRAARGAAALTRSRRTGASHDDRAGARNRRLRARRARYRRDGAVRAVGPLFRRHAAAPQGDRAFAARWGHRRARSSACCSGNSCFSSSSHAPWVSVEATRSCATGSNNSRRGPTCRRSGCWPRWRGATVLVAILVGSAQIMAAARGRIVDALRYRMMWSRAGVGLRVYEVLSAEEVLHVQAAAIVERRRFSVRTRESGLVAGALAALAATPAMADEWWLQVFMGGEKPARLVVAIDEDYIGQSGFFGGVFQARDARDPRK